MRSKSPVMLVSKPATSISVSLRRASSASALSLPPLQLNTTDFFTTISGELLDRFSTNGMVYRGSRYRMLCGSALVHAELGEYPLSPLVENFVERRNDDESQKRRGNHPTNYRSAQRRTKLGPFTDSHRNRKHTGNKCQRGHHDGTQTNRARLNQR